MSLTLILACKTQREKKKSDSSTHSFRFISSPNYYYCPKREKDSTKFLSDCCVYSPKTLHSISDYILLLTVVSCLRTNFQFFNNHNKNGIEIAILKVERLCTYEWSKEVRFGYFLSNQEIYFGVVFFSTSAKLEKKFTNKYHYFSRQK